MRLTSSTRPLLALCAFLAASCDRPAEAIPAAHTKATSNLPVLTERLVDNAALLDASTEVALTAKLAALEAATSDQLVVVTVPSLGSETIEALGLRLGNGWGIGQKEKNNGVLLIVAPAERKVRIEVGTGLEPVLTNSASAEIIDQVILPHFRRGNLEEGVVAGTEAIIDKLRATPQRPGRKSL